MSNTKNFLTLAQARKIQNRVETSNGQDIIFDREPRVIGFSVDYGHVHGSVYVFLVDQLGNTVESFLVTPEGRVV